MNAVTSVYGMRAVTSVHGMRTMTSVHGMRTVTSVYGHACGKTCPFDYANEKKSPFFSRTSMKG